MLRQALYYRAIPAEMLGAVVQESLQALQRTHEQVQPQALLYAEKRGGFQCRTCCYATARNGTHGHCAVVQGTIHLDDGCCIGWIPDPVQLHLYRAPEANT